MSSADTDSSFAAAGQADFIKGSGSLARAGLMDDHAAPHRPRIASGSDRHTGGAVAFIPTDSAPDTRRDAGNTARPGAETVRGGQTGPQTVRQPGILADQEGSGLQPGFHARCDRGAGTEVAFASVEC